MTLQRGKLCLNAGFIQCKLNVIIYEDLKQKLASVRAKTEAAAGQAYNPST